MPRLFGLHGRGQPFVPRRSYTMSLNIDFRNNHYDDERANDNEFNTYRHIPQCLPSILT